jgi:hypothetical protein
VTRTKKLKEDDVHLQAYYASNSDFNFLKDRKKTGRTILLIRNTIKLIVNENNII